MDAVAVWRRWRVPLSIGVLDQAAVSATNFTVNILLARWMSPADYGAFAIAFATLLLVSGFHGALLTDPLSVIGSRRPVGLYSKYLRALLIIHAALTLPLGAVIAASGLLPRSIVDVPPAWTAVLGFATPLVLLLWLLRAACYLPMRPGVALAGSLLYGIVFLIFLTWGHLAQWLTAPTALVLMGVASGWASLFIATRLELLSSSWAAIDIAGIAREHWAYGRWILGAAVAHGIAYGLYVPLVGMLVGLEQTAVLRALLNLTLPLQQVLAGIAMVAYPSMSRRVAERGIEYMRRRGPIFVLAGVGLATVYGLVITAFGRPLLVMMYGGGYYAAYASLIPLIAVAAVVTAVAQFLSILARVVNRPQAVLWSKLAAAAWLAGGGILLVRGSGVRGAVLGLTGGSLAEACVLAVALTRGVSVRRIISA
jgi:O-antigen/teichoic acid export membrane protein